jgi:hypothetical protein
MSAMSVDYEKMGLFYLGRQFDAATRETTQDLVLYDSRDLTTHAVCVGMTGSGKTGLCLSLLEEAAIDGIPAICIDPKGDLGNLMLTFPQLAAADFKPWLDPADAARKGVDLDTLAERTAENWRNGLAEWQQGPERIARLRDAVDINIYTPGATTGLPLSVLRSFAPPPADTLADATALRERTGAVVSGLLSLLGREADPLQSREYILLAAILENAWREGRAPDLAALIHAVQKPPFDTFGAFDLETFFPAKDRLVLAMAINNLMASPGFSTWLQGEPLEASRLLRSPSGKPRLSIISIAHLGDAERMFVVTLLLNEVTAWMRAQSGSSSLRAILYMDEIFGYFPPGANPPSKTPMLTLLKQGRAFGLGCVLATQNPVDLDYKGLGNCGTWFIGRLQTERDKMRVIEGLDSALAGAAGMDRGTLDQLLSTLAPRVFLMRNVHEDAPCLMQSRWALSFLRGPLTGNEITRVMGAQGAASAQAADPARTTTSTPATTPAGTAQGGASRPLLPPGIREYFLDQDVALAGASTAAQYQPQILGKARLHYLDNRLGIDQWLDAVWIAPLDAEANEVLWREGLAQDASRLSLSAQRLAELPFATPAGPALRPANYARWVKSFTLHLQEHERYNAWFCELLKLVSAPGETEAQFRQRLLQPLREKRDELVDALRRKYAPKLLALQDRVARAEDRLRREQDQLQQQKLGAALSVGASILGAVLGRKVFSSGNIGRASSAVRSASRIGRESGDVQRADETLEELRQRWEALQEECEAEVAALSATVAAETVALREMTLAPRKSDLVVKEVALVWIPGPAR